MIITPAGGDENYKYIVKVAVLELGLLYNKYFGTFL